MRMAVAAKWGQEKGRELKKARVPNELTAEELSFGVKLDAGFETTQELTAAQDFSGQERALAALELGPLPAGITEGKPRSQPMREWLRLNKERRQ